MRILLRQMVVLVSDGNSQDPWEEVLEASKRLQETGADVYAVTVSRKYMFRYSVHFKSLAL